MRRPLVVSWRTAVSKTTFVTMALELSFPRLPMLVTQCYTNKYNENKISVPFTNQFWVVTGLENFIRVNVQPK